MNIEKTIYRAGDLAIYMNVSRVTLWRWRQQNLIPQPIYLGKRVVGWQKSTIDEWLRGLETNKSQD